MALAHAGGVEMIANFASNEFRRRRQRIEHHRVLGLAQVALSTIPSGPNMVELTEALLDLLHQGGIELDRAAWAVDLLTLHTSALAAERDNRRGDDEIALGRAQEALGSVSPEEHPHIHALGAELFSGEQSRYDWALDVLINGVLSTPRP